ncbi:MAG: DUF3071 domain-containing protein [Demequinaceae bacterium]|nr:DUF3071 domain-containing protein [Demequinaceae bacterium]
MIGARLKGLSEDGTHLLVVTDAGEEVKVAVTDELRALVRHARITIRDERPAASGMPPREIQQRIRAGLSAAELAHLTGEPVEALAKFEAPVLAERAYIVELARSTRIGRDATSPTLGDLVGDRLAGRAIDPAMVEWDAWRELDEPWRVAADFVTAGRTVRAMWTFDHVAKALTAEDEESTWLTETELLEAPIPRRHLAAVRPDLGSGAVPLAETRPTAPAVAHDAPADSVSPGDALLQELADRRGTREPVEFGEDDDDDDDEAFEGFGPRGAGPLAPRPPTTPPQAQPSPHQRTSMPHPAGTARPDSPARGTAGTTSGAAPSDAPSSGALEPGDRRSRKGRASIPSWDEIVFGAKND